MRPGYVRISDTTPVENIENIDDFAEGRSPQRIALNFILFTVSIALFLYILFGLNF